MCLAFMGFIKSSHNPWDPNKGELRSESRVAETATFFSNKIKGKIGIYYRKNYS